MSRVFSDLNFLGNEEDMSKGKKTKHGKKISKQMSKKK